MGKNITNVEKIQGGGQCKTLFDHSLLRTSYQQLKLRRAVMLACIGGCLLAATPGHAADYTEWITGNNDWYIQNNMTTIDAEGVRWYNFLEESVIDQTIFDRTVNLDARKIAFLDTHIIHIKNEVTDRNATGILAHTNSLFQGLGNGTIDAVASGKGNLAATGVSVRGESKVHLGVWNISAKTTLQEIGTSPFCMATGVDARSNEGQAASTFIMSEGNISAKAETHVNVIGDAIGVRAHNANVTIGKGDVTAESIGRGGSVYSNGLLIEGDNGKSFVEKTGIGTIKATAVSDDHDAEAYGIQGRTNTLLTIADGNQINAAATGSTFARADGVLGSGSGVITVGNGDIQAAATSTGAGRALANGVYAWNGGAITVGSGKIDVRASGSGEVWAYGLRSRGDVNTSSMTVGERDISVTTDGGNDTQAIGIQAEKGTLNIDGGSIKAEAKNATGTPLVLAVYTQSQANVNINETGGHRVQLDSEIRAIDQGKILLKMDTAGSYLKGLATEDTAGEIDMTLKSGATWDNSHNAYNADKSSSITKLTVDGGVIKQNSLNDITVNTYSGSAAVNYKAEVRNGQLLGITGGNFIVRQANGGSIAMNTDTQGINTLDTAQARATLESLANKLQYDGRDDGKLTGTATVNEGRITPWAKANVILSDRTGKLGGEVTIGQKETTTMRGVKSAAATSLLAWRSENDTFSKRLGDLRIAPETEGIWARVFAGETEYDSGAYYQNRYNTIQVGWDKKASVPGWRYGGALSYTDGSSDFERGSGDNSSTALAIYGSWLGDDGRYFDIIAKKSKLRNEYSVYGLTEDLRSDGDYDTWGTSLSLEYGKRIALKNNTYIEPQAELSWGHVGSVGYTMRQDVRVNQDSLTSLVGRLGIAYGKKHQDSSVYIKASLLHEFDGKTGIRFTEYGVTNTTGDDFGDTWGEIEIGGMKMLTENSYFYADIARAVGASVKMPWQANAGVRWSF